MLRVGSAADGKLFLFSFSFFLPSSPLPYPFLFLAFAAAASTVPGCECVCVQEPACVIADAYRYVPAFRWMCVCEGRQTFAEPACMRACTCTSLVFHIPHSVGALWISTISPRRLSQAKAACTIAQTPLCFCTHLQHQVMLMFGIQMAQLIGLEAVNLHYCCHFHCSLPQL